MSVNLSPIGNDAPFVDSNGDPLSGGKLYTYTAGSSTPENTYTTSAGSVANANPVVLGSTGYPTSGGNVVAIWLTAGVSYKFVLENAAGTVLWTRDNISGINDTTVTIDQWVSGPAPTYISATSFSLAGDQTSTFQVGRRVKTTNSGGTIYSTITASAYGALTTVTVANDSGTLDSGLSAVSYGLISKTGDSMPRLVFPTIPQVSKHIYGLTYSINGSDPTNDIDIDAGGCMDATGAYAMTLASTLTKQSDAAWAVGTNAGWLDTGAIGNSDYYIWLIARSDTGVVDSLLSLSSTAPTMPANYNYKRLIGWIKRSGGTIVAFTVVETDGGGIQLDWSAPTQDVALSNTLTTSRRTDAVKVPLNLSVLAHLSVTLFDASTLTNNLVCCPDLTDVAPNGSANNSNMNTYSTSVGTSYDAWIRTSSAGLIAARSGTATVDTYQVSTLGFRWSRR